MFEMILAVRDGICLSQLYVCWRLQYFNVFHVLRYGNGSKTILPQLKGTEHPFTSLFSCSPEGRQGLITIFSWVPSHEITDAIHVHGQCCSSCSDTDGSASTQQVKQMLPSYYIIYIIYTYWRNMYSEAMFVEGIFPYIRLALPELVWGENHTNHQ